MLDPLSTIPFTRVHEEEKPPRKLLVPSPDHPDDYILELDYSHGISSFLECPRRWQNQNLLSREGDRPPHALEFGKLFHSCEELALRFGRGEEVLQRQRELVIEHFQRHPVPPDEYRNADRMLQVLTQYNQMYLSDGWPKKLLVHENEKVLERAYKVKLCTIEVNSYLPYLPGQLVEGFIPNRSGLYVRSIHVLLTGRIDAVITEGNFVWVVDHKTSSRGGSEFTDAFRLSLQTRGYCWAVQKLLGVRVTGLLLNAIICRRPTKTGNATEFLRSNYFYSQDLLDEYESSVRATASDIVANLQRGFFPQASRSFKSPCAGCDYHENCTLPPHQRHADLQSSLYRNRTWDPTHE